MIFKPLTDMIERKLTFSQSCAAIQKKMETVIMASVGQVIIKHGCPDCDGDLIIKEKKENNVCLLECQSCNSEYYVTLIGECNE